MSISVVGIRCNLREDESKTSTIYITNHKEDSDCLTLQVEGIYITINKEDLADALKALF